MNPRSPLSLSALLLAVQLVGSLPAVAADDATRVEAYAAAAVAGTLLLDLHVRSLADTGIARPLCGFCFGFDPTVVWFHATLLANGDYSGGLTTRHLQSGEELGLRSDLFSGRVPAERLRRIRQKLSEARVGEQGRPCAVALRWSYMDPQTLDFTVRRLTVGGELTWFGPRRTQVVGIRGEEDNAVILACPEPLKGVVLEIVELVGRRP